MVQLFEDFLREKIYLKNISAKTVRFLCQSCEAYKKSVGESMPTKELLNQFVIESRLHYRNTSPTNEAFLWVELAHSRSPVRRRRTGCDFEVGFDGFVLIHHYSGT